MKKNLKSFLGDTIVYGVVASLNKAISLLLFPLLVVSLSETEYGLYDYFNVLVAFFVIGLTFGFDSGLARFYYNSNDKSYRDGLVTAVLILHILFFIFQFIFSFFAYRYVKKILNNEIDFFLLQINILFQLFIGFSLNLFRWSKERLKYIVISVGILVLLSCSLFYLKNHGLLDLHIALYALTIVNGFFFILSLFFVKGAFVFQKSFIDLKKLVIYSIPLGIIGVLSSFTAPFERTIILSKFSELELTKYSIAYKIGIIITLGINAFHSAWGPFVLSRNLSAEGDLRFIDNLMKYFLLMSVLISIVISGLSPHFIAIFTNVNLISVFPLIFLISLVFICRGLGWIFETSQTINKSSKYLLVSTIIHSFLTLGLIIFLSNLFGLLGIAFALLFGQLIKILFDFFISRKFGQLFPSDSKALIYLVIIIFTQCIHVFYMNQKNWLASHLLMFLFSLLCFFLLFYFPKIFKIKNAK